MTDIGHVAANHSVWDLELGLSVGRSLWLLIYADFRVKQTRDDQGRESDEDLLSGRRPST